MEKYIIIIIELYLIFFLDLGGYKFVLLWKSIL